MSKIFMALGWPVAIVLVIALAYQRTERGEASPASAGRTGGARESAGPAAGPGERIAKLEREVAALSDELAGAHYDAYALQEQLLEQQRAAGLFEAASQFEEALGGSARPAASNPSGEAEPGEEAGTALASGESGSEVAGNMASLGARLTVDSQYAPFIDSLELDPETAELVRQIMIEAVAEQGKMGMRMMSGGPGSDAEEAVDYEAWMRDELSLVLTPEDLQYFDEFQAAAGGLFGHQMEAQLNLFASDLTPENRDLARQVLVEEMRAPPPPGAGAEATGSASVGGQLELYRRAADRLATVFDAEQIAIFDQFVARQSSFLEMAVRMMASPEAGDSP